MSNPAPLVLSTATKREAFHLAQAIEGLVYYPDRTVVAGLVALAGAFHGLVQECGAGDTLAVFRVVLDAVLNDRAGLAEDDPAMRGYVHPQHETVQ